VVDTMRHFLTITNAFEGFALTLPPAVLAALAWTWFSPGGRRSVRQMIWFVATVRGRASEKK
jgi:hypothetical protein